MIKTHLRIAALAAALAAPLASAQLAPIEQDFESLDQMDAGALTAAGFVIFGNVFNPAGDTFLYGYGVFGAPNGSGGFSNVASGEGGAEQGEQQLVVFNDYNNPDHNIGNIIESNVFIEQTIVAADVGSTWEFSFDAKKGDIAGDTTALAFIKTLDPANGFALTNFLMLDTTDLPETWNRYTLSLEITSDLENQRLQVGFANTTTNFQPSGVFYDNLTFGMPVVDSDGDGVGDDVDNCTDVPNPLQRDTDGDGFGNFCDADLNNDNVINVVDLGILRSVFFSADPDADLNGDGVVNVSDLGLLRVGFFGPPGPGAGQ